MTQKPFGRKNLPFHRMAIRIPMKPLHDLILEMPDGKYHRIANISVGGIGLFPDSISLAENEAFKGHLSVGKKRIPVDFEVAHRSPEIIGCRFKNPDSSLRKVIESFFELEMKSLKLTRAEKSSPKSLDGEKTTFYRGQNNCEFVVLEKNNSLVSFSIILFGNYIEFDVAGGLTVGQSFEKGPNKNGVFLFRRVDKPGADLINVAVKFVNRIEGLAPAILSKVQKVLSEGIREGLENKQEVKEAP